MNDFHMACFASLSRTRSFLLTAREFSVSTQAVIRSVKRLEEELGYRLFIYKNQEARLTEAGRMFMKHYLYLDRNYSRASDLFRMPLENTLSVAACAGVDFPDVFLQGLTRVRAAHPDLQVRYLSGTVDEVLAFARDGTADIALLPEPALSPESPLWDRLVVPLCELPLYCMLSDEYCPGGKPDISVFSRLPCYLAPGEEQYESFLNDCLGKYLRSIGAPGGESRALQNACSLYTELLCGAAYTISTRNHMTERIQGITALPMEGAVLRIMALIRKRSLNWLSTTDLVPAPEVAAHE